MKRGVFRFLLLLTASLPAAGADVEQSTKGDCSPVQNGDNNVVVCTKDDPRTNAHLNDYLDSLKRDIDQKTREAGEAEKNRLALVQQLADTRKQLEAKGEDTTLVRAAQDLLHEGKLDEARGIFDRLIRLDDTNVDRAAKDHFARATVLALQFRMNDAIPDYALAFQYQPNDLYAGSYANALMSTGNYNRAESVLLEEKAMILKGLAKYPALFRPDLGAVLNNLGELYHATSRIAEAKAAYIGSLSVFQKLIAENPAEHQSDLAGTLSNLGNLYTSIGEFEDAEPLYKQAADILSGLAAQNPNTYEPRLAFTLSNLGAFYDTAHRFTDAEAADVKALDIWGKLVSKNADAYKPGMAATLNNLGTLYYDTHRFPASEAAYIQAIEIRRDLAKKNPATYLPLLAKTMLNLGNLYRDSNRSAEAVIQYKAADSIGRRLEAEHPVHDSQGR